MKLVGCDCVGCWGEGGAGGEGEGINIYWGNREERRASEREERGERPDGVRMQQLGVVGA